MVNSGEVNGTPGHANGFLLKDVLRGELGLQGFVVSDWVDIKKLVNVHHIAQMRRKPRASPSLRDRHEHGAQRLQLQQFVARAGARRESAHEPHDEAVAAILTVKYQLGLFDDPLRGIDFEDGNSAHRNHGRSAWRRARESITLLKNENHTLPLAKTAHVLVTGPDADSLIPLNNGWSYTWQGDAREHVSQGPGNDSQSRSGKNWRRQRDFVPGTTYNKEVDIAKAAMRRQKRMPS